MQMATNPKQCGDAYMRHWIGNDVSPVRSKNIARTNDNLFHLASSQHKSVEVIQKHCVTTEKVPAKYRSFKMAEASLGKWSIFGDCGGIAWTKQWLNVHMGNKIA